MFPYDQIYADVAAGGRFGSTKMCVDEVNLRLYQSLVEENIVSTPDLLGEIKMVKNERQLRGYRECQIRDGAALLKFFAWMRDKIQTKGETLTEYEGMLKLTEFRAKNDLYMGDSFETILSTGANGAIIHYTATAEECKNLDPNDMILCDSGGHYKDGTTDTTRTIHYS